MGLGRGQTWRMVTNSTSTVSEADPDNSVEKFIHSFILQQAFVDYLLSATVCWGYPHKQDMSLCPEGAGL